MENNEERRLFGVDQLSLRSLIIGMLGSGILTASSMYVALRISALPWATIFVAVFAMALLKALGRTTLNEINITQTAMSAGAMVAGGLAFTLPGLWITKIWSGQALLTEHYWQVCSIALVGVLIGTIATWFLRVRFLDQANLPYPIGVAAAETIISGDAGGKKAATLFGTMGLSALFTFFREKGWLPSALTAKTLYANHFYLGIWLSPMAVGIGYMIGTLYTGVWFIGSVLAYLIIIPFGPLLKIFVSPAAAVAFKNTAGIGLMVGTGIGILLTYLWGQLKNLKLGQADSPSLTAPLRKRQRIIVSGAITLAYLLSIVCRLSPLPAALLIIGIWVTSAMASIITGETGINPMEIFGIIVLLGIRMVTKVDPTGAFFIAAAVAIACGYSGDLLNDYKVGKILGTNPEAQLISQIAGGVVGALVASVALFAVIRNYGGVIPSKELTAGQAYTVSQMVSGVGDPTVLGMAMIIGALLYILKVPSMTLGLGMYLSFEISAALFLGGLIRWISKRFWPKSIDTGNIAASGFFGGEGITGVIMAIINMIIGK
jgi:uncharacterized oligopeptide transporter (OPT) family protein